MTLLIPLMVSLAWIACPLPGAASGSAPTAVRQIVTVSSGRPEGEAGPSSTRERVVIFGDGFLSVREHNQTLLFDEKARRLQWTDWTHGTMLETSLPVRLSSILSDVSALRFHEQTPARFHLQALPEVRRIAGRECRGYLLTSGSDGSPEGTLWALSDLGGEGAKLAARAEPWWRLLFPLAVEEDVRALGDLPGPVLEYDLKESLGGRTRLTTVVCAGLERGRISPEPSASDRTFIPKPRVTYQELLDGRLGPGRPARSEDENGVLSAVRRFQDGYRRRDLSALEAWVEELMAPDVFILGTDGAWPDSWEWRSGLQAAAEMFDRDWRRWGSLKIFEDEMHLAVEGDAAWVAAFAIVVREGGDDDASRMRAAARLKEYAASGWSSRRILYEAMADAAQVLVQYERDSRFVTPLRVEFGLVKREGTWKFKMIHFSHPATGFRSFRLLNAPPDLLKTPGGRP